MPGRPDIEYSWDEYRYRFATLEDRELFKADPARYAPQFADFCAMALAQGEVVEANPQYWLIRDGKLYIFGKPVGPDRVRRDLSENIVKANQNRTLVRKIDFTSPLVRGEPWLHRDRPCPDLPATAPGRPR